jgi:hypothetical protein
VFVRGARLALAVAAVLALLAGCSNAGSKPVALKSITPTPSATAHTSAPPEATSAAAAVKRYFALKSNLANRMDTAALGELETGECACRKFLESIRVTAARGQHYFGKSFIRSMTASADGPSQVEVLVEYDTTVGGTKDASGRVVFRGPARRGVKALFDVQLVGGRWLIADIASISSGHPT